MSFIEIRNVSKIYKSEDGHENYAMNHVSLSFPNKGLIAIVGKSGSGKSTIINMLSLIDKPSSGHIYINRENIHQWKKKRIEKYHNQDIGILFQHYHLLENHTVLFNIMLPALIAGEKEKKAKEKAIKLLESISFSKNLYNSACKNLSGGEKERVALLRAIINDPKILLCDEPTGALDSQNSEMVMEILKNISQERLVIIVSHNISLTNKYADRVITIKDGKIESDDAKIDLKSINHNAKKERKGTNKKWVNNITFDNFKRRITRNIISTITLIIGLVASLLIIGFSNGSTPSITKSSYAQLDYGLANISKQKSENIAGSKMSLVQQTRPTFEELNNYRFILNNYEIENNFSSLVPRYLSINVGEEKLTEFSYNPIYSFLDNYINKSILIEGYFPTTDNLFEVVVNKKAYEILKKKNIKNPFDITLDISVNKEFHYYTGNEQNPCINDIFSFQKNIHIVGVVEEMNFLSTPKIYYPYRALVDYLFDYPLNNLSSYLQRNISWYERVAIANNNDDISSYSYYLFLKDIDKAPLIENHIDQIKEPFVIESTPVTLSQTLLNLVNAATMGMEVFLIISILGTALILGIVSFSSYSEDKKIIAILSSLGANRSDIKDIYTLENVFVAFIALTISFVVSPLLALLINNLVSKIAGFSKIVVIPFARFMNMPFLLPLIIVIATFFIAVIATVLPISLSNNISLKKELMDE